MLSESAGVPGVTPKEKFGVTERISSEESLNSISKEISGIEDGTLPNRQAPGGGERGNLLATYSEAETMDMGRKYANEHGLDPELFAKGAAVARAPKLFNDMDFLTDEEREGLHLEQTKRYHIPRKMVEVIALGSVAAAVQGMDQSVINGATLFYPQAFGLPRLFGKDADLVEGLVNGAPYVCCAIACWTSDYWNRHLGRRWTIFWTCAISFATCFWQGFVNNWWHLFIARFFMGVGVGVKSATVPVYAAECAPAHIRGSLVMLWQFFTAFGIMLGYVACLAFYYVPDRGIAYGLNWRLMLGSASLPAIFVCVQVPFVPELPRWLMGKGRHQEAFESYCKMRKEKISAARDLFYQYVLLLEEHQYESSTIKRIKEMFTIRRNRNASIGSWLVMFMQQFCGINVIAYYSLSIFIEAGFSVDNALIALWGFGMMNFVFAIPAILTIDKFGRRNLLLTTFPLMCIFLIIAGCGFLINKETNPNGQLAMVIIGVYFHCIVYSSGEGPVPFTYSAECFPLYIRDLGMSWATSTCWFFNFILAFTWPRLVTAFTPTGAFMWYAGWNFAGFWLVLFCLYETKSLTLEELDDVFSVPMPIHAKYQFATFINDIERWVFRRKIPKLEPFQDLAKERAHGNSDAFAGYYNSSVKH
ncbi:sugar porter family MFS transporter [Kocuria palustris]|nr:sugar porter family MFS transporter [Kocuria palustris]